MLNIVTAPAAKPSNIARFEFIAASAILLVKRLGTGHCLLDDLPEPDVAPRN